MDRGACSVQSLETFVDPWELGVPYERGTLVMAGEHLAGQPQPCMACDFDDHVGQDRPEMNLQCRCTYMACLQVRTGTVLRGSRGGLRLLGIGLPVFLDHNRRRF